MTNLIIFLLFPILRTYPKTVAAFYADNTFSQNVDTYLNLMDYVQSNGRLK